MLQERSVKEVFNPQHVIMADSAKGSQKSNFLGHFNCSAEQRGADYCLLLVFARRQLI